MSAPWWAAFPPITVTVSCARRHRLRWQDGKLTAADHPDAESELVLAALGGEQPECVRLVGAWGRHSSNLDVLTLGPRSAADRLTLPEQSPVWHASPTMYGRGGTMLSYSRSGGGFSNSRGRVPPDASGRLELLDLLRLGHGLTFRLMAAAAANAAGTRGRPRLTAALSGRLAPAARTWLGVDPDRVEARIHDGDGWGDLELTGSGELRAALPARWLASVWAPGLAVINRKLAVDVIAVTWPTAEVLAVSRPGTEPESLPVVFRNRQWSVARR